MEVSWEEKSRSNSPLIINLQLYFTSPLYVSYEVPDLIRIDFADADLFISESGVKIPEEHR